MSGIARSARAAVARAAVPLLLMAACSSASSSVSTSIATRSSNADAVVSESTVTTAGVRLHVRSVGPAGAAQTIITVHGGPGLSLEVMAPYDALAGNARRVIGYDQRGSGSSTTPNDGDFSLAAQVTDLDAVRAASGADTVTLIGESWGGILAEAYTATHPDHVRALVLVGAVPLDRDVFLSGEAKFRAHITELQAARLIPTPLPTITDNSCRAQLLAELPAYVADPHSVPSIDVGTCSASTSRASYSALLTDQSLPTLAAQLGAFRGPALVVMGDHDAFGLAWLDRNVALLTGARVTRVAVTGAGHVVTAEQGPQLLARINTFLAG